MEIIAAMVIAFILGAYIRSPFVLFKRNKITDMTLTREKHFTMDIDPSEKRFTIKDLNLNLQPREPIINDKADESIQEEKRQSIDRATQLENMWNYTERVALEKDKEAEI